MATKQFILVVYDISNDKRRTKLHDVLLSLFRENDTLTDQRNCHLAIIQYPSIIWITPNEGEQEWFLRSARLFILAPVL